MSTPGEPSERILFVHAHPDDETIDTGGTIATLIDAGAAVTVLTCTRGERGELIPDPARKSQAVESVRESELRTAMGILGVTDHRFLGDDDARWSGRAVRTYADSGMQWGPRGAESTGEFDPASLTGAEFGDVAADIAAVILDLNPDAVISYDARGGYGHPDHLRVYEAVQRASDVYGVAFYSIDPWDAKPREEPSVSVDITPVLDRKRKALAAYSSQLTLANDTITFVGGQSQPMTVVENYRRAGFDPDEPVPFGEQHPAARFFSTVVAGVIGFFIGALLSVYNQSLVSIAGQEVWLGAIVGTLVVAAVLAGFRLAFGTRIVTLFCAVGIIVVVGLFSIESAGGTSLIPWNGPGILWQLAPTIVGLIVIAWPTRGRLFGRRQGGSKRAGRIGEQV